MLSVREANLDGDSGDKRGDSGLSEDFVSMIRRKVIHGKEAYLLVDLFKDAKIICKNLTLSKTSQLKKILMEKFGDELGFFPSGRNCIHAFFL